jgi:very-short-patch-repair endonuclease
MKEIKKRFARTLRKEQTNSEKIVWELIRDRKFMNLKFRRQHVIEGFILDFYCHEIKLGIEIDGGIHNKRKDYDRMRQTIIESEGISVIRVSNRQISNRKRSILEMIKKAIGNNPPPLPLGEGGLHGSIVKHNDRVRVLKIQ